MSFDDIISRVVNTYIYILITKLIQMEVNKMAYSTGAYTLEINGTRKDYEFVKGLLSLFSDFMIGETNILSFEENDEKKTVYVEVEPVSTDSIVETIGLLKTIRDKQGLVFNLCINDGFIDNDNEYYTLLGIKLKENDIFTRLIDYTVEADESDYDSDMVSDTLIMKREDAEHKASEELAKLEWGKAVIDTEMTGNWTEMADELDEDGEVEELYDNCFSE